MAKDLEPITGRRWSEDPTKRERCTRSSTPIEAGGIVALAVVGASLLVLLLMVAVKAYVNGQPR